MPHVIETASSGRAACRGCGAKIAQGELRMGERLPNPFADEAAEMTHWYHLPCGAFRRPEAFLEALPTATEPIEDRDQLQHEANLGIAHRRLPRAGPAGRAPTGRATCRACRELIAKDAWRIALSFYEDGRFVPSGFIHARCAGAYLETTAVMPRIRHFSPALGEAEFVEIQHEIENVP